MEDGLLELLKKNPNLSLNHTRNTWYFTGEDLRDIKLPDELAKEGYQMSTMGIYKEVDGKKEYLAMFCLD